MYLLDDLHHFGVADASACCHIDGDRAEEVEAVVYFRAEHRLQLHELAQRSHLSVVADEHVAEVALGRSALWIALKHDAIDLRELVHVADVRTAAIAGQGTQYRCWREAGTLALSGINLYLELREVALVGGNASTHFGVFAQLGDELLRVVEEESLVCCTGLVLQLQFDGAHAVAGNHTGLEDEALSFGNLLQQSDVQLGVSHHCARAHHVVERMIVHASHGSQTAQANSYQHLLDGVLLVEQAFDGNN